MCYFEVFAILTCCWALPPLRRPAHPIALPQHQQRSVCGSFCLGGNSLGGCQLCAIFGVFNFSEQVFAFCQFGEKRWLRLGADFGGVVNYVLVNYLAQ